MSFRLLFITGGARSGKSHFAQKLAEGIKGRKVFLATAQALDEDMKSRIEKHKEERSSEWDTIEEAYNLNSAIKSCKGRYEVIVIDCLTMWISNLLTQNRFNQSDILREVKDLLINCNLTQGTIIIVSNEVGLGIVPANSLSRLFRDIVGRVHQEIASIADEVYLIIAGIPMKIKGKECSI